MARIKINDPLVAEFDPELAEREVELTEEEKEILRKAMAVCEKAGVLQAKINEIEGTREEENDFEWARFYLVAILGE